MARVVVITGLGGSGKTSVAEELRSKHGFVHFDGDLWASGANPVAGDYKAKLGEQAVPSAGPEHKERFTAYCNFLLKLRTDASQGESDSADVVDEPEAWRPFFTAFCEAVQRCRATLGDGDGNESPTLVVSYSIYLQSMRDFVRTALGENTTLLVLQLPREVALERIASRCVEQYAQVGKSVEEWKSMLQPNQAGFQDEVRGSEPGTVVVQDDGSLERAQVVAMVEKSLQLIPTPVGGKVD